MKLNPSPITTPEITRSVSNGPDTYQMMAHMTDVKCAAGCANFNETLLVCGNFFAPTYLLIYLSIPINYYYYFKNVLLIFKVVTIVESV